MLTNILATKKEKKPVLDFAKAHYAPYGACFHTETGIYFGLLTA